ncbi:MAG TPA: DUF1385 domain-containing protein [Gaiellaceae bacterium]|jgi:uncharacterized protein YqhQ
MAGTPQPEEREIVRLGGMALPNGVLVHGPSSWACAIRHPDGRLEVASAKKGFRASAVGTPLLRGPARLLEALAVLPALRRRLPGAQLPFERPGIIVAALGCTAVVKVVRDSTRLTPVAQELLGGLLSLGPATIALRSSELAAYHGAEHIAIGSYEAGEPHAKEHERCGSHLIGPLLVTTAFGNIVAGKLPERWRGPGRVVAQVGALGASTEIFAWMTRNPERPLARALAYPGHELQHRLATSDPTPDQLAVAEAALAACLELERDGD